MGLNFPKEEFKEFWRRDEGELARDEKKERSVNGAQI
jgi:hypothetical protein